MTRGYVIVAENTPATNYVRCAEALAASLKHTMPNCSVALLSNDTTNSPHFDFKIPIKQQFAIADPFKITNDIQAYELSPYDQTIKLEADMFIPGSIDYWWDVLAQHDMVVSSTIRDFKGQISSCRVYRRFIDDNALPDVYNAITYFKKSGTAEKFYQVVNEILKNWPAFRATMKCNPTEEASTDWVYALACHIVGVEKTTLPTFTDMCMTHMKQFVNGLPTENWTDVLLHEFPKNNFRVNTYTQKYPFHYHVKTFSDIILERQHD